MLVKLLKWLGFIREPLPRIYSKTKQAEIKEINRLLRLDHEIFP